MSHDGSTRGIRTALKVNTEGLRKIQLSSGDKKALLEGYITMVTPEPPLFETPDETHEKHRKMRTEYKRVKLIRKLSQTPQKISGRLMLGSCLALPTLDLISPRELARD